MSLQHENFCIEINTIVANNFVKSYFVAIGTVGGEL